MKNIFQLGLACALVVITLSFVFPGLYQIGEWKTLDLRFQIQGKIDTDPRIIMVDADDTSSDYYGRWPWKRSVHSEMIKRLNESGAKTIIYDVLFADPGDSGEDNQLIAATKQAGNIVLPFAISLDDKSNKIVNEQSSSLKLYGIDNTFLYSKDKNTHPGNFSSVIFF